MLDNLKALEKVARQLEPSKSERTLLLDQVIAYADNFLEHIDQLPAFVETAGDGQGLYQSPLAEEGEELETLLKLLEQHVDRPGLNPASGGHLGYIPGGGIFPSALGDYLAAVTNRYAGVFFASPGAVRMENMLLEWMAGMVGYPHTSGGNLTSGGSIANLIGIVTARDAHGILGEAVAGAVIYGTGQMHHAVNKAIRIAGLQGCIQRTIATDNHCRMDTQTLQEAIIHDKKAGLRPWLVVASAGTTNTGSVDPLTAVGDIARAHDLWFHIDGAYGAFFALCEEGRKVLAGMEKSDSIVMDPHKTLFLPYGSGAVLVRDREKLYRSHYYQADYMQDVIESPDVWSPADLSPELTKHFRGLRLWLPLKLLGLAPFRAALAEKIYLARYFYHRLQEIEGFEVGPYPDLSVVTYRYVPPRGDADEFNRRLVKEIHKDGRIFLSSTQLNGRFTLRLAVAAFRTHLDTIEQTLEILAQKARALQNDASPPAG